MRCSLEKVFTAETCGGRTDRENAQNYFFLSARRRSAGRAGPGGFVDFRCGSRTLWFLTSRTLCLPTLGWILSPWILCPRWAHHRTIDLNTRMCCHLRVYLRFWREKVDQHRPHIASVGTLKDPSHRQAHSQRKKIVHFSRRRVTKLRNARTNFFFFFEIFVQTPKAYSFGQQRWISMK